MPVAEPDRLRAPLVTDDCWVLCAPAKPTDVTADAVVLGVAIVRAVAVAAVTDLTHQLRPYTG